jgi:hypothetical protein
MAALANRLAAHIWDHQAMAEAQKPVDGADGKAHDVLAAEAFAVPAPDPTLHHGPVVLPADPTGIEEPHDVLAAEEFAMPAVHGHAGGGIARSPGARRGRAVQAAVGLLVVVLLFRLLRRR